MKERIHLTISDLNNVESTLKELLLMIEKITIYYVDTDIKKSKSFVEKGLCYFYLLCNIINNAEGDEE